MFSEMDITEREKVRARLDKRNKRDRKRRKLETVEQRQAKLAKRNESDWARTKKKREKKYNECSSAKFISGRISPRQTYQVSLIIIIKTTFECCYLFLLLLTFDLS